MFVNDRFQLNTKSYLPSLQNYEKNMKLRAFINYFLYFCMKITVYLHELTNYHDSSRR